VVIATDHRSVDGTSDILRDFERDGRVVVLREESETIRQSEWTTRMSRLAATVHAADWVIPSDADEFWWPRYGSFHEALEATPPAFGVVRGLLRSFVLRPGLESTFERLVIRVAPSGDLASPYHGQVKVAHRGVADATVGTGNHDASGTGLRLLREWFPFEVLHFPLRSVEQLEDKFRRRPTTGRHTERAVDLIAQGRLEALVAEVMVDDGALAAGLRDSRFVHDVRLRDALRVLAETGSLRTGAALTLLDDAQLAAEATVVLQHDSTVIAEAQCTRLEHAVALLEQNASLGTRVARRLRLWSAGDLV
jgi:hypothetical protein